jgi:amino acid adenylation domain-containing protein
LATKGTVCHQSGAQIFLKDANMLTSTNSVADLSREKQALLLKRLSEKNSTTNSSISKRQHITPCHLSFAQERLWFVTRLQPGDPFYNMAGIIQIRGPLDVALLEQALNEVVRRHEILRTSFAQINDEVRQIVHDHGVIELRQTDLSNISVDQQHQTLKAIQKNEACHAFDLECLPLLRTMLIKLRDEYFQLSITLHHIIADEWSLRLLIKEVGQFYRQMQQGQPVNEPELVIQYADFAEWQRQYLQGKHYEQQLSYWRDYLTSAPGSLDLPTDYSRPSQMTNQGGDFQFVLPGKLSQSLINLSRQTDTTLFAVMMAAFNVLLWRYSGQSDICIGYPIANRNRQEVEGLIGFFVNLQVLRSNLSGNPSSLALLQQIKRHLLVAQSYQDLPFERLVGALQPQRELNRSPIFQVMLDYQHTTLEMTDISGLQFEISEAEIQAAKYDLILNVCREGAILVCHFNYSTDLFTAATIATMAEHLKKLMEAITEKPESVISELGMLTLPEQQQILYEWNATDVQYSNQFCIHRLFEIQAEKTPNAIAIKYEDQTLSYVELNSKANQLAHYLATKGAGPDVVVALGMQRSLDMFIALLATIKAGAAYLPLDLDLPLERLKFMLEDSEAVVLLTQAVWLSELPFEKTICINLNVVKSQIDKLSMENPPSVATAQNLAYVIYTSGTTNKPKGVMVSNASLVNAYYGWRNVYRLGEKVRAHLQMANFSFDVCTGDFVRALLSGDKLVICPKYLLLDAPKLYELLRAENIGMAEFVPAVLRNLISYLELEQKNLAFMDMLICGSDSWTSEEYNFFRGFLASQSCLINSYGLTEVTIDSFYYKATEVESDILPIGRPFANTRSYILDKNLQLVPIGVVGELCLAGIGLARGYLKRPDLSAEKFIPDPYGPDGSRLYKTGDLARYRADGNIEYLGRIDNQVKIRGFRIELGEIEAQLLRHTAVKEAVVLVREDHPGDKRLVAYLVEDQLGGLQLDEIKDHLKQALPDYMVPIAFVVLDKMPLSANGKVDRKNLPPMEWSGLSVREYIAPQGEIEMTIAEVWQQLLGIETVGRNDHFFEMGGHSLLVINLIQRLREKGFSADVRMIFAAPVLANLAMALARERHQIVTIEIPPNLLDTTTDIFGSSPIEEFRI